MQLVFKSFFLLQIFIGFGIIFSGCSSKEHVNPDPEQANIVSIKDKVKEKLYEDKGYLLGKKDGFRDGLEYSKGVIKKFLEEARAIQFANYLMEEKYIQPGPIIISEDGKIILSKMEIREPYTLASLYDRFGGEIPNYVHNNIDLIQEKIENNEKNNDGVLTREDIELNRSIKVEPYEKEYEAKEMNNIEIKKTYVEIINTKSNQALIKQFGLNAGTIDDKMVVRFNSNNEANDFCRNFKICLNMEQ